MKGKFLLVAIIASFLLLALLPSVDAAIVPDNPEETTVAEIEDGDTMVNNRGTVTVNNGIIQNNYGTVVTNNGLIINNHSDVTNNNGTIINNYSEVTTNDGRIENSLGSSDIYTNTGYVINLVGSIATNGDGAGNGTVMFVRGGDITTNNDDVYFVFGNSTDDLSPITTNSSTGTVYSAYNCAIGTNNGTVVRLGPGSAIGGGTGSVTSDYSETSGLWVGNTLITNETKTGPGWSFNSNTFTLTLEDANITTSTSRNNGFANEYCNAMVNSNAAIYNGTGKVLSIVVIGNNTISADNIAYGIYSEGGVNIAGTGTLNINLTQDESVGIRSLSNVRTTSGTISSTSDMHAILANYGRIDFDGGTITASATNALSAFSVFAAYNNVNITEGILNIDDMDLNGNLTMSGGTVNATGLIGVTGNPAIPGRFTFNGGTINFLSRNVDDVVMYASEFDIDPAAVLTNLALQSSSYKATAAGDASISIPVEGYEVSFDANGGSCATGSAYTNEQDKLDPPLPTATRTGYTFAGWFTEASGGNEITENTVFTEDKTVYAHWTINQYTITFNSNGGSAVPSITQNYGTAVPVPANPTKEGYKFTGWTPTIPTTMPAANITLTAGWGPIPVVTFDANGGTCATTSATVNNDGKLASLPDATRTGYAFTGWFTAASGGDQITANTVFLANTTIHAHWTINQYTITFDTKGGSAVAAITQDYDTAIVAPANPTRAGYVFDKWDPAIPAKMPAENITINALWFVSPSEPTSESSIDFVDDNAEVVNIDTNSDAVKTALADEKKKEVKITGDGWKMEIPKEIISGATGAVSMGAKTLSEAEKNALPAEVKELVKDKRVFSLSLSDNSGMIPFTGKNIKVSLPYTLKDGENASDVKVFYIDANNKAVKVSATYDADGKCAVFETDHFSNWYVDVVPDAPAGNNIGLIVGIIIAVVAVVGVGAFVFLKKSGKI